METEKLSMADMVTPAVLLDDPVLVSSENDEDFHSTGSESLNFDEDDFSLNGDLLNDDLLMNLVGSSSHEKGTGPTSRESNGSFPESVGSSSKDDVGSNPDTREASPETGESRFEEEKDKEPTNMEEIHALLAKEMNKLSIQSREEVLHDVHGVSDIPKEDPEFVADRLAQFDLALNRILSAPKANQRMSAYQEARDANPDYVNDEKFRLMFLRCEMFNPDSAARKMLVFLECKRELFPKRLVQDIRIDDLNADDKRSLESGFFQLLPARDPAGRAILCGIPPLRTSKVPENYMRMFYYMVMTALSDEETQKKGMVFVGYNVGHKSTSDRTPVKIIMKTRELLPVRVVTLHYCHDNARVRPMMFLAAFLSGAYGRVRFRPHYGTPKEIHFKLSTFGIPIDALPMTEEGEVKLKPHRQWLQKRRKEEKAGTNGLQRVVVPSRFDVLFGRGKPIQEHPGNLRYHQILESCRDRYDAAKKFEKMEISDMVVQLVKEYEGQFLKQDGAGWVVATVEEAREKVSHAFRTRRSATKTSNSTSGTAVRRRVDETPEATLSAPMSEFSQVNVSGGKRLRV